MKRSMFVVLVLMAAIAAYGSDKPVRAMDFNARGFAGPVCYPGGSCGWPGVLQVNQIRRSGFIGPVCLPGDPCGPWPGVQRVVQRDAENAERLNGPMCMPGDPCGPGTTAVGSRINFSGPMCFPGDPCGPGGVRIPLMLDARGPAKFNGPMCMPGDPCGPGGS